MIPLVLGGGGYGVGSVRRARNTEWDTTITGHDQPWDTRHDMVPALVVVVLAAESNNSSLMPAFPNTSASHSTTSASARASTSTIVLLVASLPWELVALTLCNFLRTSWNYHIKNVVLFEGNSTLPLPECLESSGW